MSENLSERVEFFRRSIQQMIDSRAEPSYDLLRSLLVEDERLAEWERRTGTAPQRPKADPKQVCQKCGDIGKTWDYAGVEGPCPMCAPVPQTEGECPQCGGDGKGPLTHHFGEPCPTCSGTGKDKA